jgi:hypothetical protein
VVGVFASAAMPKREAAAAEPLALVYARLRGGPRPVFWVTRGVKYAQRGPELQALHGFVMIESIAFDRDRDGAVVSRTLEAGYGTDLEGRGRIDTFAYPGPDTRLSVAAIPPMVVTYRAASDGVLSIPDGDPRRADTAFSGSLRQRPASKGEFWIEESFASSGRAKGAPALREVITYRARGDSFDAATKTVVAIRSWPYGDPAPGLALTAIYEGKKFVAFDAFLADIDRAAVDSAYPGFITRLRDFR